MREDMFKVIVERPRRGAGMAASSRKRLNKDGDLPVKIGISRHMGITHAKSKWLSENLAPLKRYLGKQVGRPWREVHGDILATLRSRDPVQQHVLDHIKDFVALHVAVDGKGQWTRIPRRRRCARGLPWRQRYYVDPRDGVLRESAVLWKTLGIDPKPWKQKPPGDPNIRVLDKTRELRRIEGIWYDVHFHREPETLAWVYDLLQKTRVPAAAKHAIAKRQLSRDELLAFGITNIHN